MKITKNIRISLYIIIPILLWMVSGFFKNDDPQVQIQSSDLFNVQTLLSNAAEYQPFRGTIVPMEHYHKDQRVPLLMIEINRWIYLGEGCSVDSERLGMLVEILGRVGNVLLKN